MKRIFTFILYLFFFFSLAEAQYDSLAIDSLNVVLEKATGINRANVLVSLAKVHVFHDAEKGMQYAYEALQIAQKFHDEKTEAEALHELGVVSYFQGNYENSRNYLNKALAIYQKRKDTLQIYSIYGNLGVYFYLNHENDSALFYFKKAMRYFIRSNQMIPLANSYNNVGLVYLDKKEYDNALYYYKKSLTIKEQVGDSAGIGHTFGNIGLIYLNQENPEKAIEYINESFSIACRMHDFKNAAISSRNIAQAFEKLNEPDRARQYYENSMKFARHIKSIPEELNTAEVFAEFYEKNQLSDSAIVYYKLSNALKDTIKNQEFHQKITKSIASYEQKLQEMKTERQKNIKYWLIVTIGMGFLILIILLRQYRIKQRQNRQLKIMNQKMMVSETKLRQLNHTKDKLFSIIAHDLKNPFIALLSISKALIKAEDMSKEEQKEYISKMYISLKSLNELLENLLSWARSQLNKVEYYPEFFMPEDAINQAMRNLDLLIDQKNITVNRSFPDGIEVYADKTLFRIVVENLLSNALKFSRKDAVIEIIGTEKEDMMEIQVKDFGVGMTEETKKNLFKFKYLTSASGTEGERGTGLGIHICKEFVEKNNGEIWVESHEGKGTIFTFTVPKLAKDVFN